MIRRSFGSPTVPLDREIERTIRRRRSELVRRRRTPHPIDQITEEAETVEMEDPPAHQGEINPRNNPPPPAVDPPSPPERQRACNDYAKPIVEPFLNVQG